MKKTTLITLCALALCSATATVCTFDFSQHGLYFGRMNHLKNPALFDLAKQNAEYVVFKFSASWCGPCQHLTNIMNQLVVEFPNVLFVELDIEQELFSNLINSYKIKKVPTVILFKNGQRVHRSTGGQTKTYWTDIIHNEFDI